MKNLFYSITNKERPDIKKDFDNYSKTPEDILMFYFEKYPEIDTKFKLTVPFDKRILKKIEHCNSDSNKLTNLIFSINKPFELYILGFILHMLDKFKYSILSFEKSLDLLSDNTSISQLGNKCMIKLQLSQLYDRIHKRSISTRLLISIIKDYKYNEQLFIKYNNLLASAYMRLGIYLSREYKNISLSHFAIYMSIEYRKKFRNTYPKLVYEQYMATALRNLAHTIDDDLEKYLLFKEAIKFRLYVLDNTLDEFNKVETIYLLFDFLRFLISKSFKNAIIRKYSRILLKTISSMKILTRKTHSTKIVMYAIMLSRYWQINLDIYNAFLWQNVAIHLSENKLILQNTF